MEKQEWLTYFQKEAEIPFAGWDFTYLTRTGRMKESPMSWNYASIVRKQMKGMTSMLDMGTGGGELLSLLQPFPARTVATEGYPPNIAVARNRLEPLGVSVVDADGEDLLPFPEHSFDLVINRHESYVPSELHRILASGGLFMTQQVGGQDNLELNRLLHAPISDQYAHWNLHYAVDELKKAGFTILDQKEEMGFTRYYDIGAIIYYVKAIEWQFLDFTVERYAEKLLTLHERIESAGYVDIPIHRFFLIAQSS